MHPEKTPLSRFGARWMQATEAPVPALDLKQGTERLLRAEIRRPVARRRLPLWLAAAAAIVTAMVLSALPRLHHHAFTVDNRPAEAGLHLAESAADQVLRFAEGSIITLTSGSSLAVSEVDARGAHLSLEHGSVKVDIVTRPNAKWTIDAGPFVVRVVGTAFRVDWEPDTQHFLLTVVRGAVSVQGPMLGEGRLISGGKQCTVDWKDDRMRIDNLDPAEGAVRTLDKIEPSDAELPPEENVGPQALDSARAAPPPLPLKRSISNASRAAERNRERRTETWQSLERAGQFQRAVEEAERVGLDTIYELANSEDLMSLARAARFVGREDVSKGALLSCRRRFPAGRDSAMAAYLLGRNASPSEAIKWFSTYLTEQPDGVWAREAAGRLIEAHRASGNTQAAREAAKQYLDRYPAGPHAEFAKKVLEN